MKVKACKEHVECLQERIGDFRHCEGVGLVIISIGIALVSLLTLTSIIFGFVLVLVGVVVFFIGGHYRRMLEKSLCELLKARETERRIL